jgi:transposase InsO family protein
MRATLRPRKPKAAEALDRVEPREVEAAELRESYEIPKAQWDVKEQPKVAEVLAIFSAKYPEDRFFKDAWKNPERHSRFEKSGDLLWTTNRLQARVICVPQGTHNSRSVRGIVIDASHETIGHMGYRKTLEYIRRWFWWPSVVEDIDSFCKSCGRCQVIKASRQKPAGWLHTMPIPSRPWQSVGMDFTGPFVEIEGHNYILLVICRFTGMVHLIPTNTRISAGDVARIYIKEIVRLHGVPESIVSDRDSKFNSEFWREISSSLGQRLLMSTAYHPQTDGSSERGIQTMSQILRAVVNDYQTNWVDQLPMVEFAMNSSISSSTGYAPFESNYGWLPRLIQGVGTEPPHGGVAQIIENIKDVFDKTYDKLTAQRERQAVQANKRRREGQNFKEGDEVLLSTENLNLPKGRARKLCPKYVGPYKVLEDEHKTSNYRLKLPPDLSRRRVHDVFHENVLKPFVRNNDELFPGREALPHYDFGDDPDREWIVKNIVEHKWAPGLLFKVQWEYGDSTWESLSVVEELQALDNYLELEGVSDPLQLRRK